MNLPQEKQAREFILDRTNKCVTLLNEVDTLKEDIASYVEEVSDKYDMKKSVVNKLIKTAYDAAKVEVQIEELQTSLSDWDILQNMESE
tara:strand:+ start:265 stop:531 length:267 start_codon:yes stop_codon:yes gene_type:complete